MHNTIEKSKILAVGEDPGFREVVRNTLENSFEVVYASNANEGLVKAKEAHPEAIVLGYLEPRGTSFEFHKQMREGWVTKHIPLLVVDVRVEEMAQKGWRREEGIQMDADDYVSLSQISVSDGFKDMVSFRVGERLNKFKQALIDPTTFCVTWEQIPGRGAFEKQQEETIDNVRKAAASGKIHAVSITDNPGGNPAISTEMLCAEIKRLKMEPLVHLAARDKNRNELESVLHGLTAVGVRNILVLTGDAPSNGGFSGKSKPVFDLDPVHVLQLIGLMNKGLEHEAMRKIVTLAPTDFFAGACVSPFKKLESELMGQYYKLGKKIQAGAEFLITQVGYDARKFHEVLQWIRFFNYDIPVLANIYILPYGTAKVMNSNQIPGCIVTDKLVMELAEEAKDKANVKSTRLLRAAKMYAIAKGIGCAGAHIGGHGITYEMVEGIIDEGEKLSENWESLVAEFDYPQKDGFYFFERNPKTGLNTEVLANRPLKKTPPLKYRFTRIAHTLLFNEKSLMFKMLQPLAKRIDASQRAKHMFGNTEHLMKVAMFGCMDCGDCALFDVAYVCPMSQCPKNQRNGPCGGSYDGWCEVYPNERRCVWVQAYERLKAFEEEDKIGSYLTPPCNWELWETSSWLNFYLGRDHTAKRLGIKPPEDKPPVERSSSIPEVAGKAKA